MVVGHTKFTPDSCFGLIKQRFRRTHVQCLSDMVKVVEESATVNRVKLVGNEAGVVYVPTHDWLSFFAPHMKRITRIKNYHQFCFSSSHVGTVICKEYSDSIGTPITILKKDWEPSVTDLPPIITPSGLSAERQWYLYEKIRPFCDEPFSDITCPLPLVSRPNRTPGTTPVASPVSSPRRSLTSSLPSFQRTLPTTPPPKRVRVCAKCGQPGHNRRTCEQ